MAFDDIDVVEKMCRDGGDLVSPDLSLFFAMRFLDITNLRGCNIHQKDVSMGICLRIPFTAML
jgi:hypothetical protein